AGRGGAPRGAHRDPQPRHARRQPRPRGSGRGATCRAPGPQRHPRPAAAPRLPAALLALDAALGLLGPRGMRRVGADEFFRGLLATALAEDELLAEITVPVAPAGWGFAEIARRPGDFALAGVAASLDRRGHARV